MKELPVIMYDQTQFSSLYWMDKNGVWISEEVYDSLEENSGYKPNKWYLYSQSEPESFFFGAYDKEALTAEAEEGINFIGDKNRIERFESKFLVMYDLAKEIKESYHEKFKGKELQLIKENPKKILEFFNMTKKNVNFMTRGYLLTQPQRFYKIEEKIKNSAEYENLIVLMENGQNLSPLVELRMHFLIYVEKIRNSGLDVNTYNNKNPNELYLLNKEIEKFGFLNQSILGGKNFDLEEANKEIPEILNNWKDFNEELKQLKIQQNRILERNQLFQKNSKRDLYQIAEVTGRMLFYRIAIQTYVLSALYYFELLIKSLMEVYSIKREDIDAYSYQELILLVKDGRQIKKEELQRRKLGFLIIFSHEGVKTLFGKDAHNIINNLLEFRKKEIERSYEFSGMVASWPNKEIDKIKGNAFVLTSAFNVDKRLKSFKEDSILVATQTHPNLVPTIKRAKAIITDEGGLTCHAAIISRELGKPCVIGTRIATKGIKDGDQIEVDLSKGIIKIIKKAH